MTEESNPNNIQSLINRLKDNIIGLYADIYEFQADIVSRAGQMVTESINQNDVKMVNNMLDAIKDTKQNVLELDMLLTEEISNKVDDVKVEEFKTEFEKEGIEDNL